MAPMVWVGGMIGWGLVPCCLTAGCNRQEYQESRLNGLTAGLDRQGGVHGFFSRWALGEFGNPTGTNTGCDKACRV